MNIWLILGLAFALAMDCFAVSLGVSGGARRMTARQSLGMAFSFGLFQFVMPLVGWVAGENLLGLIRDFDHWVAFGLLAFVGGKMIYESFESEETAGDEKDGQRVPVVGPRLLVLSLATSIDSLGVGLGLGVLGSRIVVPAAVIGAVSFAMTMAGARLGPVLGKFAGKRAELFGGLVLIGIGVRILVEHLGG